MTLQNAIDDILTRECLFCGSILIDMIDNDLTGEQSRDYDFYEGENQQLLGMGGDDDEWNIE